MGQNGIGVWCKGGKMKQQVRCATVKEGYTLQSGKTYRCPPCGGATRHDFVTCPYRVYTRPDEKLKKQIEKTWDNPNGRPGVVLCGLDPVDGLCYAWEDIEMERKEKDK